MFFGFEVLFGLEGKFLRLTWFQDSLSSDQSECIRPPPPKPHKHKRRTPGSEFQQNPDQHLQHDHHQQQLDQQQHQQQFRSGGPNYHSADHYGVPELGTRPGFSRIQRYGVSSSDDEIRSTPECTSCGEEEIESESVSEKGRREKNAFSNKFSASNPKFKHHFLLR
jgi:hypothetical protein